MNNVRLIIVAIFFSQLLGCASTPKGEISYYFPKAETQFTITQTLACNSAGTSVYQLVTISPVTTYTSDTEADGYTLNPKTFDGFLADTDLALNFTDDGRLSGINLTSAGQGQTVIQDVVAIAKIAIPLAAAAGPAFDATQACKDIENYAGKSAAAAPAGAPVARAPAAPAKAAHSAKAAGGQDNAADSAPRTVALTYVGTITYQKKGATSVDANSHKEFVLFNIAAAPLSSSPNFGTEVEIEPDAGSSGIHNTLIKDIPELKFTAEVLSQSPKVIAAAWRDASPSDIPIQLNSVANAQLILRGPVGDLGKSGVVWTGQVPVPLTNQEDRFFVPVPQAAIFGTHKFALGLSAYGSIEKLEYSTTGSSDAANAGSSLGVELASALKKPTTSDRAASIQAQADLIYEQQRLIVCQATPKNCASK
ncbi:hypothetical protein R69619_00408 [Paraburkholderia nemoris]|uniref:hypothetical protein n=1 Tax=Paraburkholderia nemoris TaxID=2793076 RepID=UPI00190B215F|nr:hypothetical protein [Paraburkholderia nemoris]MBK3737671.1 hypothetical protein [Paraburkholderia aspalathi]CAE6694434.1 hypothetical protein R69619_00408 [Paraburkholderia nemoris]